MPVVEHFAFNFKTQDFPTIISINSGIAYFLWAGPDFCFCPMLLTDILKEKCKHCNLPPSPSALDNYSVLNYISRKCFIALLSQLPHCIMWHLLPCFGFLKPSVWQHVLFITYMGERYCYDYFFLTGTFFPF